LVRVYRMRPSLHVLVFGQQEDDARGDADVPQAVHQVVVAPRLQEGVADEADEDADEADRQVDQPVNPRRVLEGAWNIVITYRYYDLSGLNNGELCLCLATLNVGRVVGKLCASYDVVYVAR
jgi:hypothetical protein